MASETTTRETYFPVYRISHDDGRGRYTYTLSFRRHEWAIKSHMGGPDGAFVVGYSHDEGFLGTIAAPVGSTLVEAEDGDLKLKTPDGWLYSAAEAHGLARSGREPSGDPAGGFVRSRFRLVRNA